MASDNELNYDGFGFDKGLDMSFDEEQPKSLGDMSKREVITEGINGTMRGVGKSLINHGKWIDAIRKELPGPFKETWKAFDDTKNSIGDLYDQAQKEIKPVLGQMAKSLDTIVPDNLKRTKKVTSFLKEKLYQAPGSSQPTPDEIRNRATEAMLGEVFKGLAADTEANDQDKKQTNVRRLAETGATQKIEQDRFNQNARLFSRMDNNIQKQTLYQERVGQAVDRKGLELSFRKYTLLAEISQQLRATEVRQTNQLSNITIHTGLPEYKKMRASDRFKDEAKRRMVDSAHNMMFGEGSMIENARKKMTADIKEGMGKFRSSLEMAAMGLDEVQGTGELIKDTGQTVPGAIGDFAGGWLGDLIRNKLVKKAAPEFTNDPEFKKFGHKMGAAALNPNYAMDKVKGTQQYQDLLNGRHGNKVLQGMDYLESLLKIQKGKGDLEGGHGLKGMNDPGNFTKRLNIVQTEVVPGYLARILREVTMTRTGRDVPMLAFDAMTGKFKSSSDIQSGLSKMIDKSFASDTGISDIKGLAETLKKEMSLEDEGTNEALIKLITSLMHDNKVFTGDTIKGSKAYEKGSAAHKKIFDDIAKKLEGDTEQAASTTYKFEHGMRDVRRNLKSSGSLIQQMLDAGHQEELIKMGLVIRNEDGSLKLADDAINERIEKTALAPSDVELKKGFRSYSGKKALEGLKKVPISRWNYKDQKNGRGEKVGPMAQDLQKQLGENVAPGGRKIDLVSANGVTMAAVKELAQQQEEMEKAMNGGENPSVRRLKKATKAGWRQREKMTGRPRTSANAGLPADDSGSWKETDYLSAINQSIKEMHETLKTKNFLAGIPGFDFSKFQMPDVAGAKDKAKKLMDPLLKTGNEYIDTLQSLIRTGLKDGQEAVVKGFGQFKEKIFHPSKDAISSFWGKNKDGISDKKDWLIKEVVDFSGKALKFGSDVLFQHVPDAIKAGKAAFNSTVEKGKQWINGPVDVYLKNNPSPVLLAIRMRAGVYAAAKTGKVLMGVDDLLAANGDIIDISKNNEVALRWSDAAEGLFDQQGKPLRTSSGLMTHVVMGAAIWAGQKLMAGAKKLTDGSLMNGKFRETLSGIKDSLGKKFNGMAGFNFTDMRQLNLLAQIRDLNAIGKKKHLVEHVYDRKLDDEKNLAGTSFLNILFGDKFKGFLKDALSEGADVNVAGDASNNGSTSGTGNSTGNLGDLIGKVKNLFQAGKEKWRKRGEPADADPNATPTLPGPSGPGLPSPRRNRPPGLPPGILPRPTPGASGLLPRTDPLLLGNAPSNSDGIEDIPFREIPDDAPGLPTRETWAQRAKRKVRELRSGRGVTPTTPLGPDGAARPGLMGRVKGMAGKIRGRMGGKVGALMQAGGFIGDMLGKGAGALKGLFGGETPMQVNESNEGTAMSTYHDHASTVRSLGDGTKGKSTFSDRDGNGDRDGGSTDQTKRFEIEDKARKAQNAAKATEVAKLAQADSLRYKSSENQIDALMKNASSLIDTLKNSAGGLFEMGKSVLEKIPGLGKILSGAGSVLKGAGRLVGLGAGKLLGGGKGLVNGARAAYAAGGAMGVLKAGAGAARTGLTVARTLAMASGGVGGTVVAAGATILQAGLALMASPVFWGAAAAVGVGYGLYKGYKYFTRNSLTDYEKLRAVQYGLNQDSKDLHKVMELEGYFLDGRISYTNGTPTFNAQKVKADDILKIMDIDPKDADRAEQLSMWMNERFKPFFLNHVAAMFVANPKLKLTDVEKLDYAQTKVYLQKAEFSDGPYDRSTSPFESQQSMANTQTDVEKMAGALKEENEKRKNKASFGKNVLKFGLMGALLTKLPFVGRHIEDAGNAALSLGKRAAAGVGKAAGWVADKVLYLPKKIASFIKTVGSFGEVGKTKSFFDKTLGATLPFAIAGAIKKGFKYFNRNKLNDLEKFRAIQYGLNQDSDDLFRVMHLEGYFLDGRLSFMQNEAKFNTQKVNSEDLLEIMGISKEDKKRIAAFETWMLSRFKPFFLNHASALFAANPKLKLTNIDSIEYAELQVYLDKAQFLDGPYDVTESPFDSQEAMVNSKADIPKLVETLRNIKKKKAKVTNTGSLKDDVVANLPAMQNYLDAKKKQAEEAKKALNVGPSGEFKAPPVPSRRGAGKADGDKVVEDNARGDDGGKKPISGDLTGTFASKENQVAASALNKARGPMASDKEGLPFLAFGKGAKIDTLHPSMRRNLLAMAAEFGQITGKKVFITDGTRTREEQEDIYRRMPHKAARPGTSMHEFGLAVDIAPGVAAELEKMGLMRKYGFTRPVGGEDWHTEPAGLQLNLDRAKKDSGWAAAQIDASPGRGGGGYGSQKGSPLLKRSPALAKSLWESTADTMVDNKPKDAANDSKAGATVAMPNAATPGQMATGSTIGASPMGKGFKTTSTNPAKNLNGTMSRTAANDSYAEGEKPPSTVSGDKTVKGYTAEFGSKAANDKSFVGAGGKQSVEKTKELVKKAALKTGMNPDTMQLFAAAESGMGQNQNGGGKAQGPMQFMPGTWKEVLGKYGAKYGLDPSTPPTDTYGSSLMAGEYLKQNTPNIQKHKSNPDIIDYYLSHMLGGGGVQSFLRMGEQDIPAKAMPGAAASNSNIFYKDGKKMQQPKTAAEMRQGLIDKFSKLAKDYGVAFNLQPGKLGGEGVKDGGTSKGGDTMMAGGGSNSGITPAVLKTPAAKGNSSTTAGETLSASYTPSQKEKVTDNQVEERRKPTETLRGKADVASGVTEVLQRSLEVEEKLLNAVQNDMVPVLRKMQDTLEKMYTEGKAMGKSPASAGATTPERSRVQASSQVDTMSSTPSVLDRQRKYG